MVSSRVGSCVLDARYDARRNRRSGSRQRRPQTQRRARGCRPATVVLAALLAAGSSIGCLGLLGLLVVFKKLTRRDARATGSRDGLEWDGRSVHELADGAPCVFFFLLRQVVEELLRRLSQRGVLVAQDNWVGGKEAGEIETLDGLLRLAKGSVESTLGKLELLFCRLARIIIRHGFLCLWQRLWPTRKSKPPSGTTTREEQRHWQSNYCKNVSLKII